ncbi:MAG: hypothetical protein MJB14_16565 [Spirochaetes bacterium]|nr:hypothetical protein [Spirochaetota bacterium]
MKKLLTFLSDFFKEKYKQFTVILLTSLLILWGVQFFYQLRNSLLSLPIKISVDIVSDKNQSIVYGLAQDNNTIEIPQSTAGLFLLQDIYISELIIGFTNDQYHLLKAVEIDLRNEKKIFLRNQFLNQWKEYKNKDLRKKHPHYTFYQSNETLNSYKIGTISKKLNIINWPGILQAILKSFSIFPFILSLLLSLFLSVTNIFSDYKKGVITFLLFLLLFSLCFYICLKYTTIEKMDKEDIYWVYYEGKNLLDGINPYEKILLGNMRENNKYATYFPPIYLLSMLTQKIGYSDFDNFVLFWRKIVLIFHLALGLLLFHTIYKDNNYLFAIFTFCFYCLNRWSLLVIQITHFDFIALFLFILSLLFLQKKMKNFALLAFGLSIAVKHMAVYVGPIFLIWVWHDSQDKKLKNTIIASSIIAAPVFFTSLPFMLWSLLGYIKSILFSLTRNPRSHFSVNSFDAILGLFGFKGRMVYFLLLIIIFIIYYQKKLPLYFTVLLIFSVFINFNTVLFMQYIVWLVPLLPLVIKDFNQIPNFKKIK